MSQKKIIIFAAVAIVLAAFYVSSHVYSVHGNKIVPVDIKGRIFQAEIVSSKQRMRQGLGDRAGMCEKCGMLFSFQEAGRYSFWMKDMKFPLDLLWIHEGIVVHVEKNIAPSFVGTLMPAEDAEMVLEVNAGTVDSLNIKIGDKISF